MRRVCQQKAGVLIWGSCVNLRRVCQHEASVSIRGRRLNYRLACQLKTVVPIWGRCVNKRKECQLACQHEVVCCPTNVEADAGQLLVDHFFFLAAGLAWKRKRDRGGTIPSSPLTNKTTWPYIVPTTVVINNHLWTTQYTRKTLFLSAQTTTKYYTSI